MESSFKIVFDFNLDASMKVMHLQGELELRHSSPHYKITRIGRLGRANMPEILPDVDIKCILVEGQYKWVHTDSGKETYLSKVIGQAIEKIQPDPAVAEENGEQNDDF